MKYIFIPIMGSIILFNSCTQHSSSDDSVAINRAIEETNKRFDQRINVLCSEFEIAKMNDEKKVGPTYAKVMEIRNETQEIIKFIDEKKKELNNVIPNGNTVQKEVSEKMKTYFEKAMANVQGEDASAISKNYVVNDSLFSTPILCLSKFQNDALSLEYDLLSSLYAHLEKDEVKFDMLSVAVIPKSTTVHEGEKYEATIYLAALNSSSNPEIILGDVDPNTGEITGSGDANSVHVESGKGTYSVTASGTGIKKYSGVIRIKKPDGTYNSFPFQSQYEVVK